MTEEIEIYTDNPAGCVAHYQSAGYNVSEPQLHESGKWRVILIRKAST